MSPLDLQNVLERAKGSARVGDHDAAERLLKTYIAQNSDDRDAHLLLGTTLAKAGKLDEAQQEFDILLKKNPEDVEALNNLAVIYRRQDKLLDALEVLQQAIEIDPGRVEFHYNIGNIYKHLSDYKKAAMSYAKVGELDPSYIPVYSNLGTIYERQGEYNKAFAMFKKGLSLDRNNPTLHFNYGVALEAKGQLEEAGAEYEAAIRSKPGWIEAMNNLGIIDFKRGRHAKAMDMFNRVLDIDTFNAEAKNNIGVVYADQGRTNEAIQYYRQAIESNPKYINAVVNLERALEESGNIADALMELEKLVKLIPESAEIRTKLALLYQKMERYHESLEQASAALEWDPENVQALRVSGIAHRFMGNDEKAQKVFEHILSIDPNNNAFQLDLADIHFKRKEYKEAEERIIAFLSRIPKDRNAKLMQGKLYAEMGNQTHAIQIFEELAKADPNDTEALAAAAELQKDTGQFEKALRTADKLVNLQGGRATPNDLTELNDSLSFYEHAVNAYSSSVREMWNRNLNLLKESASEDEQEQEDAVSLLMGSNESSTELDDETEELFIEDIDDFDEEPEDFYDENDFQEEEENYQSMIDETEKKSLDNLAEPDYLPPQAQIDDTEALPEIASPQVPVPEQEEENSPEEEVYQEAKSKKTPEPEPLVEEEEEIISEPEDDQEIEEELEGEFTPFEEEDELIETESDDIILEAEEEPSLEEDDENHQIIDDGEDLTFDAVDSSEDSAEKEIIEEKNDEDLEHSIDSEEDAITSQNTLDLMHYLKELVVELPHEDQKRFEESDARLSMEFVIDSLTGNKGLFQELNEKKAQDDDTIHKDIIFSEPEKVLGTLSYLGSLFSDLLPDEGLHTAMQRKLDTVVSELQNISYKEGKEDS